MMRLRILLLFVLFFIWYPLKGERITLEECISRALKSYPSLKAMEEKLKETGRDVDISRTAFFPHFTASYTYTHLSEKEKLEFSLPDFPLLPPMSLTLTSDRIYMYTLAFQQPVFTGGKLISLYRMNQKNYLATYEEKEKVRNELVLEVKRAYISVLKAKKLVEVAQESLKQAKEHFKDIKNFYHKGVLPQVELLRGEVEVSRTESFLLSARKNLRMAKTRLSILIGNKEPEELTLEDIPFEEITYPSLEEVIQKAFLNRPEIKALRKRIEAQREGIRLVRADVFPQIYLQGRWKKEKGSRLPLEKWDESWEVVLQVNLNVWDWGETRYRIKKARAQLRQIEEELSLVKKRVELQVREAWENLSVARKKVEVEEKTVKSAEKNFRDTRSRFRVGMATNTEVIDAHNLLVQAKSRLYEAIYDYQFARAVMEWAMGKKWKEGEKNER